MLLRHPATGCSCQVIQYFAEFLEKLQRILPYLGIEGAPGRDVTKAMLTIGDSGIDGNH